MKVVHLSTYDIAGGAAQAAFHLHLAMKKENIDSTMVISEKRSHETSVVEFGRPSKNLKNWRYHLKRRLIKADFRRYKSSRPSGYDVFSDDRSAYGKSILDALPPSDVINLHWIAGFVDYGSVLKNLTDISPVCWRLSDMNPFTGGCHYDNYCGKFNDQCGACPQLGSNDQEDLSHQIWMRKAGVFQEIPRNRLHIIALNKWMADKVSGSSLLGRFPLSIIPNGVDKDLFLPIDRSEAREEFGIPLKAKVVLFLADDISNERKGYSLLMNVLNKIQGFNDVLIVSVGRNDFEAECSIPHQHLGQFSDKNLLSKVYNAADILIVPSNQDNQPNTVLESLACGTPVVAFDVGGIPEMVQDGVTGCLVPFGEVEEMSRTIHALLADDESREKMRFQCREFVIKKFTREKQVRQYLELYRDLEKSGHHV